MSKCVFTEFNIIAYVFMDLYKGLVDIVRYMAIVQLRNPDQKPLSQ